MRIIAICNQKGGSGKTTTAVNLAASLGELGRRVLVIDVDPQANASSWLGARDAGKGTYEVLTEGRPLKEIIVNETGAPGVALAPASNWLAGVERALSTVPDGPFRLADAIQAWGDGFDYVLIDTPPTIGLLTTNALISAKEVLIPVEATPLAIDGLAQLIETINQARTPRLNPGLEIAGIVLCRVDARRLKDRGIKEMLEKHFSGQMFKTQIRENTRLAEAPSYAEPINKYDPESYGAADYKSLALELEGQDRGAKDGR